eukprot:3721013-Prymnesium_polylepis.3
MAARDKVSKTSFEPTTFWPHIMSRAREHRLAAQVPPIGARSDMLFVTTDIFDEKHVAVNLSQLTLTCLGDRQPPTAS